MTLSLQVPDKALDDEPVRDQKTIQSAPSSPALSESPFVDDGSAEDVEWESEDFVGKEFAHVVLRVLVL